MCTRNESTFHCVIEFASYISEASMMSNEKGFHVKDAAVNCKDTVISSMTDNVTLTHFEEQKRILNSEFQDIEDQIVGFYLMTKPNTPSTKRIRKKIQKQLVPLYNLVRDSLEMSMSWNCLVFPLFRSSVTST